MVPLPSFAMEDHRILGVVLFLIGTVLAGLAYYSPNAPLPDFFRFLEGAHSDVMSSLILGHIFALNGVFLVVVGCRKLEHARRGNTVPR
jgi:hypothetical protein